MLVPERRLEDPYQKFTFSPQLSRTLQMLSQYEERPVEVLAEELLAFAVEQKQAAQVNWRCWNTLSHRQKEVVVLVSRGCTDPEIARKLVIFGGNRQDARAQYPAQVQPAQARAAAHGADQLGFQGLELPALRGPQGAWCVVCPPGWDGLPIAYLKKRESAHPRSF